MSSATLDDHRLARELASGAGELLVDLRAELVSTGADAATIKSEGDRQAHDWLMGQLAAQRPDDAVLSEEGADDDGPDVRRSRLDASRVWIVDPLDGTREYGEPPRDDWAVHVALCIDGEPLVGAVALPALALTLCTEEPPVLSQSVPPTPRVLVSRTRPPVQASLVAEALGADLVPLGSAGAKAMAIVRGAAEVYPHSGGQYEWDSCAPVAVARSAGLWCSRLDGSPLVYNRADPYLPDLLICRPELAEQVLRAVRT